MPNKHDRQGRTEKYYSWEDKSEANEPFFTTMIGNYPSAKRAPSTASHIHGMTALMHANAPTRSITDACKSTWKEHHLKVLLTETHPPALSYHSAHQ